MDLIRRNTLRLMLAAALLTFAGIAQASLIHDLEIIELFNFTGSGRIEFTSLSGSDASGVSAFDFTGSGTQGDYSFSQADILNISWSIDIITSVLSLNLATLSRPSTTDPAVDTCLILQNTGTGGSCPILTTSTSLSRVAQLRIGRTTTGGGTLVTTAVIEEAIPEPSTVSLLVGCLLIMGALRNSRTA